MQPNSTPVPCPVCRRIDGGHDQAMHDMVDRGGKSYPSPDPSRGTK